MLVERVAVGSRLTLVGGKGGTGKTTVAAALAVELAGRGERVLAISVDPAHSLGDALEARLGPEPREVAGAPGLRATELDAAAERSAFLVRHRARLRDLVERGSYLAGDEIDELLELAVPGVDELAAVLRLAALVEDADLDRIVVDTAPTGHTLRLLEAPRLVGEWLGALGELGARHDAVRDTFRPRHAPPPADPARGWLDALQRDVARLELRLTDAAVTRFLIVTTPEPAVAAETDRLRDRLAALRVPVGGLVVNRWPPGAPSATGAGLLPDPAPGDGPPLATVYLPQLPTEPRGPEALRALGRRAAGDPADLGTDRPPVSVPGSRAVEVGGVFVPPAGRRLYLIGGKGGVGKTTLASALAARLAPGPGGPMLLLSVDPAGSLAELWGVPVGSTARPAPGVDGLELRQLDAEAAWAAFRDAHRGEAEALAGAAIRAGQVASARATADRLLELAPPGIDELVALAEVVDLLERAVYNAIIVDTAPTGHLLRLLETPDLALGWAHGVLRLLLRYREVVGLGEFADRVLGFARGVRRLRDRLRDPLHTWIGVAALPEALSVAETRRLMPKLRGLGLEAETVIVNRWLDAAGPAAAGTTGLARRILRIPGVRAPVVAPALQRGPRGAAELRRFAESLRVVRPG